MKRQTLIFLLIALFALVFRFGQLTSFPSGFYSDEALYGYEAYSLLETGKDQFGNAWPLSIAGFGDYRPALYIYATIPGVAVFGLTEFAVRFPSALFSWLTVIAVYFLILSLTSSRKTALLGMFLISVSPWHIYFGRMAHETNLMTFFITLGVYVLWHGRGRMWATIIKVALFVLAIYTYHSARVFIPLFLVFTVILFHSEVAKHKKKLLIGIILFVLLLLPLLAEFTGEGLSRVRGVSIWNDPGTIAYINEQHRVAQLAGANPLLTKLRFNKAVVLPQVFLGNMMSHFSSDFLFTQGDPNGVYNTPQTGILLWADILLIPMGVYALFRKQRQLLFWIVGAVLFALIPDSLTRFAPSSARIHLAIPFLTVLSASGLVFLVKKKKIVAWLIVGLLITNSLWFWYQYRVMLPIQNARAWQIGTQELIAKTDELGVNYERINMSRECWGWIHVVFHTNYPPEKFQQEAKHSEKNDLGFWWVSDFGKYHLENFTEVTENNTLYVGLPREFPAHTIPLETVKHPQTGEDLFWFVDITAIPQS